MSDTSRALAQLLTEHRPTRDGDGFPQWLRDRVGAFVRDSADRGVTLAALRAELGVSSTALRRWSIASDDGGFVPVVVAPASQPTPAAPAPDASAGELRLLAPSGFALHGLSLDQALAMMKALL